MLFIVARSNIISILQNTENIPIKVTIACFIKNFTNSSKTIYDEVINLN